MATHVKEQRTLCVELIEARNVPSLTHTLEGGRAPRLYVTLKLGKQRALSSLVRASKHPEWKQKFLFKVTDVDMGQKDVKNGSTVIKGKSISKAKENNQQEDGMQRLGSLQDDTGSNKNEKKGKGMLELDLFACDAHNNSAEASLSSRVKCDGPSGSNLDGEEQVSVTSIPMPIRTLARAIVLLHGVDAAPLQVVKSGKNLPIEWIDLIPKQGRSNMPLFIFGQIGVKIYMLEKSPSKEVGESKELTPSKNHEKDSIEEPTEDSCAHSVEETSALENGQEQSRGAKVDHSGEASSLMDSATITNSWSPPASIDWSKIAHIRNREYPEVGISKDMLKFAQKLIHLKASHRPRPAALKKDRRDSQANRKKDRKHNLGATVLKYSFIALFAIILISFISLAYVHSSKLLFYVMQGLFHNVQSLQSNLRSYVVEFCETQKVVGVSYTRKVWVHFKHNIVSPLSFAWDNNAHDAQSLRWLVYTY